MISGHDAGEREKCRMPQAFRRQYDALVLFSSDTDLLPALETIVALRLTHVEVACWAGFKPLRFPASNPPRPWCHSLTGRTGTRSPMTGRAVSEPSGAAGQFARQPNPG